MDQAATIFMDPKTKVVLTTYEAFARMSIDERDQRAADEQDAASVLGEKDSEHARTAREAFIRRAAERNFHFEGAFTFSDLPLSEMMIIVDEAHNYRSLFPMPASGFSDRLVMVGRCGQANRARDMKIKLDLLRAAGGCSLGLTATPVSNSIAEVFNMLRIFSPGVLERRGIRNTQMFIDSYCQLDDITALSFTGEVLSGQTITGFTQAEDLEKLWAECISVRTAGDVGLPVPEVVEEIIPITPSHALKSAIDDHKKALGRTLSRDGELAFDHIFQLISALDKIAVWPPACGIDANPKAEILAQKIKDHYDAGDGGQVIFCSRVSVHGDLKAYLVQAGIPDETIAVFNAKTAKTTDARLKLQDQFNAGHYRVLICGDVAGEGIDLQENTTAVHFLNVDWHAQSIHQKKGRVVRQGNKNARVQIHYYLLEGTTDVYRFKTTQVKNNWWEQLRLAQTGTRSHCVFSETVSEALIASLAPNPDEALETLKEARRKTELKTHLKKVNALAKRMLAFSAPHQREANRSYLQRLEAAMRKLEWVPKPLIDECITRINIIAAIKGRIVDDALVRGIRDRPPNDWLFFVNLLDGLLSKSMEGLTAENWIQIARRPSTGAMAFSIKREGFLKSEIPIPQTPCTYGTPTGKPCDARAPSPCAQQESEWPRSYASGENAPKAVLKQPIKPDARKAQAKPDGSKNQSATKPKPANSNTAKPFQPEQWKQIPLFDIIPDHGATPTNAASRFESKTTPKGKRWIQPSLF